MKIKLSDHKNLRDCRKYIELQVSTLKKLPWETKGNWLPDFEQQLATHASGLFVWVSIVMEYLKKRSTDLVAELKDLLDLNISQEDVPAEKNLDALYTAILSKCNWEDKIFKHDYLIVMGAIITAKSPLSTTTWDTLLSLFLKTALENIISELHPLLSGTDQPSTPIQLLHQSFQDYLKQCDVDKVWTKLESAADQE